MESIDPNERKKRENLSKHFSDELNPLSTTHVFIHLPSSPCAHTPNVNSLVMQHCFNSFSKQHPLNFSNLSLQTTILNLMKMVESSSEGYNTTSEQCFQKACTTDT